MGRSCLLSWDLVPTVDRVSHLIHIMEPSLHFVNPFESLDMCPILDYLLPSNEVFLESLIQYDLLLHVGSIVTKSNPFFLVSLIFPWIVLLMLVLLSLLTLPLNSKSVILMSFIFLMNF